MAKTNLNRILTPGVALSLMLNSGLAISGGDREPLSIHTVEVNNGDTLTEVLNRDEVVRNLVDTNYSIKLGKDRKDNVVGSDEALEVQKRYGCPMAGVSMKVENYGAGEEFIITGLSKSACPKGKLETKNPILIYDTIGICDAGNGQTFKLQDTGKGGSLDQRNEVLTALSEDLVDINGKYNLYVRSDAGKSIVPGGENKLGGVLFEKINERNNGRVDNLCLLESKIANAVQQTSKNNTEKQGQGSQNNTTMTVAGENGFTYTMEGCGFETPVTFKNKEGLFKHLKNAKGGYTSFNLSEPFSISKAFSLKSFNGLNPKFMEDRPEFSYDKKRFENGHKKLDKFLSDVAENPFTIQCNFSSSSIGGDGGGSGGSGGSGGGGSGGGSGGGGSAFNFHPRYSFAGRYC